MQVIIKKKGNQRKMNNIADSLASDKQLCCGCSACAQKCPRHSITMQEDEEGFLHPLVDVRQCCDCGICTEVCPVLNSSSPHEPLAVYGAKNSNEQQRQGSSSGGVFVLLAERTIRQGGVVFGARFNDDWEVEHGYAETLDDIAPLMRSKYVQSRIGSSYCQAETFLKQGREVLFVGTSCQIRGLYTFLRKRYDNLVTADVICHGVPSPAVWRDYLQEISGTQSVGSVNFRAKQTEGYNWKDFGFTVKTDGGADIVNEQIRDNVYMQGFLENLYLRPSCHNCQMREGRSGSDLTLADYWRIWEDYPELDDQRGTSLLTVNTEKGASVLSELQLDCKQTSVEHLIKCNATWKHSYPKTKLRDEFFLARSQQKSVTQSVREVLERESLRKSKAKRIAILTHWQTLDNYGQVLQCLSLQHILKEMGHDPYVIRFDLEGRWARLCDEAKRQEALQLYVEDAQNGREFNKFRIEKFAFSPILYQTLAQLRETPPDADVYLVGSDQIWGLMLHDQENRAYWLDFGPNHVKRIAYAPSFGPNPCPPSLQPLTRQLLMRFVGISCREYSGVELLRSMGFGNAVKALDPTLLPDVSFFHSLCDETWRMERPYIFVYSINIASSEQLRWDELQSFAESKGWEIVVTTGSGYVPRKRLFEGVTYVEATIPQWLNLIQNAEMVVTPSFHGIVFCLLFHTPMVFVPLQGANGAANNRVTDLFDDLGIEGHILTAQSTYPDLYRQPLEWDAIEANKQNEKEKSIKFLEQSLEKELMTVSIITINYNNAEGLRNTIESVLCQTSKDFEYIVIDGNSTDGSKEIIEEYKDRIDYWVSEPDKGIYNAMNKGIAQARGKYCLFLNSGDVLAAPSVIKTILPSLESDKDFYSGIEIMKGKGQTIVCNPPKIDFDFGTLFKGSFRHQSTFIKTILLKQRPYKEQYKIVSDWETTLYWLIVKNASYEPLETIVSVFDMTNSLSNSERARTIVEHERKLCYEELFPKRLIEFLEYKPVCLKEEALAQELPVKLYRKILRAAGMPPVQRDLKILRNVFKQMIRDIF